MQPKLTSVLIGITFRKAFRILDSTGEIFDKLLYDNKYFSADYFPQIEYSGFQKELKNSKTGNYLRLLADNVVYNHCITTQMQKDKETADVIERVEKAIVPNILEKHQLSISRIGIVYTIEVTKEMLDKFKGKFFKDNVDVSAFRFSLSNGTPSGIREKDVHDYYNTIYSISREQDHYVISFDFQEYFRPLKPSWNECRAKDFFAKAKKEFEEQLLKELE